MRRRSSPRSCASTRSRRPAARRTRRWAASSTTPARPTNDESAAAKDPKTGEPVENPARNIWISSTAFQTALNTAYFAESVATFVIVMGAALLLVGIGFLILTLRVLVPEPGFAGRTRAGATAPAGAGCGLSDVRCGS